MCCCVSYSSLSSDDVFRHLLYQMAVNTNKTKQLQTKTKTAKKNKYKNTTTQLSICLRIQYIRQHSCLLTMYQAILNNFKMYFFPKYSQISSKHLTLHGRQLYTINHDWCHISTRLDSNLIAMDIDNSIYQSIALW